MAVLRKPRTGNPGGAFRALSSFAVPIAGGYPRVIHEGDLIAEDDPLVSSHRGLFQPVDEFIEQTTQAPGEKRPIRLPSGRSSDEVVRPRYGRDGPRLSTKESNMPHVLPPEHEDSAASTFAPFQPSAGVVADDVVEKGQDASGSVGASEATEKYKGKSLDTSAGHAGEVPVPGDEGAEEGAKTAGDKPKPAAPAPAPKSGK